MLCYFIQEQLAVSFTFFCVSGEENCGLKEKGRGSVTTYRLSSYALEIWSFAKLIHFHNAWVYSDWVVTVPSQISFTKRPNDILLAWKWAVHSLPVSDPCPPRSSRQKGCCRGALAVTRAFGQAVAGEVEVMLGVSPYLTLVTKMSYRGSYGICSHSCTSSLSTRSGCNCNLAVSENSEQKKCSHYTLALHPGKFIFGYGRQ